MISPGFFRIAASRSWTLLKGEDLLTSRTFGTSATIDVRKVLVVSNVGVGKQHRGCGVAHVASISVYPSGAERTRCTDGAASARLVLHDLRSAPVHSASAAQKPAVRWRSCWSRRAWKRDFAVKDGGNRNGVAWLEVAPRAADRLSRPPAWVCRRPAVSAVYSCHSAFCWEKIPLLGVCLGHQSIGQAFGSDIVRAKTVMHGRLSDMHHSDKEFSTYRHPFQQRVITP